MSTFKHISCRKYSFQNINWFSQGNNMVDDAASNVIVLFAEIYVFLQHDWIGLLGGKRLYLHIATPKLLKVFLWKVTEFSQGKNVLDAAASNIDGLFGDTHLFLQLGWISLFGGNRCDLHLKHLSRRQYSFQNLTRFSQENKMVDAAVFNIDDFLWADSCVSSTQLNRSSWNKERLSPPSNT
jgi:hypothetical protein